MRVITTVDTTNNNKNIIKNPTIYIVKYGRLTTYCDVRLNQEPHTRMSLQPSQRLLRTEAPADRPAVAAVAQVAGVGTVLLQASAAERAVPVG